MLQQLTLKIDQNRKPEGPKVGNEQLKKKGKKHVSEPCLTFSRQHAAEKPPKAGLQLVKGKEELSFHLPPRQQNPYSMFCTARYAQTKPNDPKAKSTTRTGLPSDPLLKVSLLVGYEWNQTIKNEKAKGMAGSHQARAKLLP